MIRKKFEIKSELSHNFDLFQNNDRFIIHRRIIDNISYFVFPICYSFCLSFCVGISFKKWNLD